MRGRAPQCVRQAARAGACGRARTDAASSVASTESTSPSNTGPVWSHECQPTMVAIEGNSRESDACAIAPPYPVSGLLCRGVLIRPHHHERAYRLGLFLIEHRRE